MKKCALSAQIGVNFLGLFRVRQPELKYWFRKGTVLYKDKLWRGYFKPELFEIYISVND